MFEALHPPIEFMIADDPRVVFKVIEQLNHQRAFVSEADVSALIYIPDIDHDRIGIVSVPAPDLRRATRQSAAIWISVVVGGWQDVTVQICRVQDRNTNRIGNERSSGTPERRYGANQSRPAGEFQKLPASPRCVRVKHRLFQWGNIL